MRRRSDAGFSLIEALVVLAIGGMALAIIFSIGVKAGDTGFGLGRRALAASDADVAISDLRSVLRSLDVRPTQTFAPDTDRPLIATADRIEADMVMERATQCAPQGWAGRLTLALEPEGGRVALRCIVGGRVRTLMTLSNPESAFSYSTDGVSWSEGFVNIADASSTRELPRSKRVWVRLSGDPQVDIVEMATSGRPEAWVRFDAGL